MATTLSSDPSPFTRIVFLCGEDMDPTAIRQRWPEAKFLGLAWVNGMLSRGFGLPAGALGSQIWGILIDAKTTQTGMYVPVTRRDGRSATAVIVGDRSSAGSLAGVLAQARYWELPRDYRDRIEALANAAPA